MLWQLTVIASVSLSVFRLLSSSYGSCLRHTGTEFTCLWSMRAGLCESFHAQTNSVSAENVAAVKSCTPPLACLVLTAVFGEKSHSFRILFNICSIIWGGFIIQQVHTVSAAYLYLSHYIGNIWPQIVNVFLCSQVWSQFSDWGNISNAAIADVAQRRSSQQMTQ